MSARSHLYISTAFLAGIIVTLAINDIISRRKQTAKHDPCRRQSELDAGGPHVPFMAEDAKTESCGRHHPPPIVDGIEGCIGNTPLIRIKSLSEATGCEILAKAELLNPAGSPKDRVALGMIQTAEEQGLLTPHSGDAIYEGTVGSTGISLATLARARGYLAHMYVDDNPVLLQPSFERFVTRFYVLTESGQRCMPSDQSTEKSDLLLKLGAVVDRVPPAPIVETGHFVNRARALARSHTPSAESSPVRESHGSRTTRREIRPDPPDSELRSAIDAAKSGRGYFADQFENQANWQAHFRTTGPEIYTQCEGKLDAFVAGAGTGGTISGVTKYLKPRIPGMIVVLADPQGSGLYNRIRYGVMFDVKEREGTRRRRQVDSIVEGIGVNRVTANFEAGRALINDAVRVTDTQAIAMAKWLVEKDGIFVGSSSAVNCFAAVKTAIKLGPGHRVVTILCDSGTRHLSKFWAQAGDVGGATDTKLEDVLNTE